MLYQPSAGLRQPLLEAGQRPRFDFLRQRPARPPVTLVTAPGAVAYAPSAARTIASTACSGVSVSTAIDTCAAR